MRTQLRLIVLGRYDGATAVRRVREVLVDGGAHNILASDRQRGLYIVRDTSAGP